MKTITFYSYKGGVGRSLALSKMAIWLSEYNKNVCILDFDIEAPGLQFKFKDYMQSKPIETGIVDYIHEFSSQGLLPGTIKEYSLELNPLNRFFNPITFIPAGNIYQSSYWNKLSAINWANMFYSEKGNGVKFFLDLKAKIKKELNPDVLLIDSRTGITDISGITLRLLADEVVILAANNEESVFGSKKIITNLLDVTNALTGKAPKVNFVLSRLPYTDIVEDKNKEYSILERRKKEFVKYFNIQNLEISVLHSDRRLEEDERAQIEYDSDDNSASISKDYMKLFDDLTSDILSPKEKLVFQNKKNAKKEYSKSRLEKDYSKKIQHLDKAIELDKTQKDFFWERGYVYDLLGQYAKAIENYKQALELNPNNEGLCTNIGNGYFKLDRYEEALKYLNMAINIRKEYSWPYVHLSIILRKQNKVQEALDRLSSFIENIDKHDDKILNSRADIYYRIGEYKKAYEDIFKAIEINPSQPIYLATLAEVYASEGKIEEFYFNLSLALSNGINGKQLNTAKEVYGKFKNEERFMILMNNYNIDMDELFNAK